MRWRSQWVLDTRHVAYLGPRKATPKNELKCCFWKRKNNVIWEFVINFLFFFVNYFAIASYVILGSDED